MSSLCATMRKLNSALVLLFILGLSPGLGLPRGADSESSDPFALVSLQVEDTYGQPIQDAVLALLPEHPPVTTADPELPIASMAQQGQRFVPHVLSIRRGQALEFPNLDQTRHHVYSFSPAKSFELKLYLGRPTSPLIFHQAGIVTLGCNIHDWMLGFVVVHDTPWFGHSAVDGRLELAAPAGRYTLWVWHPRLGTAQEPLNEAIELIAGRNLRRIVLTLGPETDLPPPYAPGFDPTAAGAMP